MYITFLENTLRAHISNILYFYFNRLPEEGGLAVNFNIHMDPGKGATSATEIDEILTLEILSSNITGRLP